MDPAIVVAIVTGVPGLLAAWGVYRQSGRANDSQGKLAETAWMKEVRQDAIDTRREMETLQDQVRSLSRQLSVTQREAEHWVAEYRFQNRSIHRVGITVDRLREMFPPIPDDPPSSTSGANGSQLIT